MRPEWKGLGAVLSLVLATILADSVLRRVDRRPTKTPEHVPLEGRDSVPLIYRFGNRTVLDVPGQPRPTMVFLSPRAGDVLVLFLPSGERGGCFKVLEVGGTFTLAPAPTCGRD